MYWKFERGRLLMSADRKRVLVLHMPLLPLSYRPTVPRVSPWSMEDLFSCLVNDVILWFCLHDQWSLNRYQTLFYFKIANDCRWNYCYWRILLNAWRSTCYQCQLLTIEIWTVIVMGSWTIFMVERKWYLHIAFIDRGVLLLSLYGWEFQHNRNALREEVRHDRSVPNASPEWMKHFALYHFRSSQ